MWCQPGHRAVTPGAVRYQRSVQTLVTIACVDATVVLRYRRFDTDAANRTDQLSAIAGSLSTWSYLSSNSWMSWPILAYQSFSIRCMSFAICVGSVG